MKIILIGFMGSGKTSVAKGLSKKLNMPLIEMDRIILEKSGRKSIKEIFEKDGEIKFRELEIEVAKSLTSRNNIIISTGGGIVINKISIDYLKNNGKVYWLKTSFSTLCNRLKGDNLRPLFQDMIEAQKLFNFRQVLYKMVRVHKS